MGDALAGFRLKGKKTDPGVTNVRNVTSPHWRRWLGIESRCVVPFTSFSENEALPDGTHPPIWFALDATRPLIFFAGIWTPRWTSVRKLKEGEVTVDLFGILATEPNKLVGTYHPPGNARDSHDARRNRYVDDGAGQGGAHAAKASAG